METRIRVTKKVVRFREHANWPMVFAGLALLVVPMIALGQEGDGPQPIKVEWTDDWRGMTFRFGGERCCWPDDIVGTAFPAPGDGPRCQIEMQWPVVSIRARWSIALNDLPEQYRSQVLDLALMYTCDAALYEHIYPQVVLSSNCRCPKQFRAKAEDPFHYDLAEALRGKLVAYNITATAGFGAPNYTIRSRMRIGMSRDGKTVFFHDSADYITANLKSRDYLVAFHVADGQLKFESCTYCICTPRLLFRTEHMRRIALSGDYFVTRLYKDFRNQTAFQGFDRYLDLVRTEYVQLAALVKAYRTREAPILP